MAKAKQIERFCKRCGQSFLVRAKSEPTKFCSRACASRWLTESFLTETGRVCTQCRRDLPLDEFKVRNKSRRSWCKDCEKIKQAEYSKKQKVAKYGLTVDEFDAMYVKQNGACAICRRVTRLAIDHNHKTGAVRQLLCEACNLGLGIFADNSDLLESAAAYLRSHGG